MGVDYILVNEEKQIEIFVGRKYKFDNYFTEKITYFQTYLEKGFPVFILKEIFGDMSMLEATTFHQNEMYYPFQTIETELSKLDDYIYLKFKEKEY
jgi:hypothetical protein